MNVRVLAPGPGTTEVSDAAIAKVAATTAGEVPGIRLMEFPVARRVLGGGREVKVDARALSVELHVAITESAPLSERLAQLVRHVVVRTEQLVGMRLHEVRVIVDELADLPRAAAPADERRAA